MPIQRSILLLCSLNLMIVSDQYAQELLDVHWQQRICTSPYINHVHAIHRHNGSTYTLGSFPNTADLLGEVLDDDIGEYFIMKQNEAGEKIYAINLGSSDGLSGGDLKVSANGDIVIGINFKTVFFLHGDTLLYSPTRCSIILRLDDELNLIWFRTFPSTSATYIDALEMDGDDNIYASILFLGDLSIGDNLYSTGTHYGTAIVKLDPGGDIQWGHHFHSEGLLTNRALRTTLARIQGPVSSTWHVDQAEIQFL